MKLVVFSIYDSKSHIYEKPFYMNHRMEALRAFESTVNDPNTSINKWPEDFTLFELGTYENITGTFELLPTPLSLGVAIQYLKAQPKIDAAQGAPRHLSSAPLNPEMRPQ